MPEKMLSRDDIAILQNHIVTAQRIRNRLEGAPLTAQEIIDGVRLSHEEYLDLVERAVRGARASINDAYPLHSVST